MKPAFQSTPARLLFVILLICTGWLNACSPQAETLPPPVQKTVSFITPSPIVLTPSSPTATGARETPPPTTAPTVAPTPITDIIGCQAPPEDYTILTVNGVQLNRRTYAMLENAARLYNGEVDILGNAITQGSYTQEVSASFGTHSGGGAVDLSVMRANTYTVLSDEIPPLLIALRTAGFAAWLRDLDELYPGSPIHIHAIAIGDRDLSVAARQQVDGELGYLRGYSGLPLEYGGPSLDRFGGPILCLWMIEQGYADLREPTSTTADPLDCSRCK